MDSFEIKFTDETMWQIINTHEGDVSISEFVILPNGEKAAEARFVRLIFSWDEFLRMLVAKLHR
jgi:hypothetical protein